MPAFSDIDAVLFDFSDVVGRMRMALAGEPGESPYRIELVDEVADVIRELRELGVPTALVTNNDRESFLAHAPDLGLDELFDVVVFSSDVGCSKPSFGIFTYALRELNVDAHRSMFLDDVSRNVDAACALGMEGVVVDRPETAIEAVRQVIAAKSAG